jgi:PAS domain S-box-containing protein
MNPGFPWTRLTFLFPPETWEYPVLAFYALVMLALMIYARRDLTRSSWRGLLYLLGSCLATLLAASLVVPFPAPIPLLPPPNVPVEPAQPFLSLLALPVVAAGAWLGAGPALLVGVVGGILRTGMTTGGIADPFYFIFFAFLVGFFLRQDYRGQLGMVLRQPIVAGPLAMVLVSPLLFLSVFVRAADSGLAGLDYAVPLTAAHLITGLLDSLVAALIVQAVYALAPDIRPIQSGYRPAPYARSLNRRLLFLFVPLILIMTIVLVYGVTRRTLDVATEQVVDEMDRDATNAAGQISYFVTIGEGLLAGFARDDALWQGDSALSEARLEDDFKTQAFFRQLMLFDMTAQQLAMYPTEPDGDPQLTRQEERLLQNVIESGAPLVSMVDRSERGEVILSFLAPMEDEDTPDHRFGVLLGRVGLENHPVMDPILQSLQGIGTRDGARGEGFVVEEIGGVWQIIAHSEPNILLTNWEVGQPDEASSLVEKELPGQAYESRNPRDNTRQLVYELPVEGFSDWRVVIRLPYEVVLEQALQIATPLLILQVLLGAVLVIAISLVTGWVTRPLQQLAAAADRIAEGNLAQPVQVPGSDEVARVGDAFEGMRVRLKDRLEDLSLLLQVSQAVSATLELPEGMPFILEGVLKATQAKVSRMVFLSADGDPQMVMSRGDLREGLGSLDRALARVAKDQEEPLVIENLSRARTLIDDETLSGLIKAVIALPVRTKNQVPAVMWVGYGELRQFDASEVDLLSTLAGQTAVLVENARLFQAAEGGRRRLAAILSSTTDAVLVTDRDDRVLLANPAAERAFSFEASMVVGRKIDETEVAPGLAQVFVEPLSPSEALTAEVPLPDGRTLYASVSTILSANGERIGRVAMMRDITRFKELDELKTEFVATVSHDLRSPLTFMRGYTTMLPMVDDLSDKQQDYIEKILQGIGQMSNLIDDLLDLGRIEAGVGLERKPCHLGAILIEAVDSMRVRATTKGLALRLEPAEKMAVVSGDATSLRQVVTNLVDNAIKYTPNGGTVTVGLSVLDRQAIIRVSDTGIGIAPDDQVRLFEKFYRIKRRDTMNIPGTGLGLAIVKSIIERHNGRVWVESELDKGSTFYVSLPLYEAKSDSEAL